MSAKSDPAPSTSALTHQPAASPNLWDDVRLQRLWLSAQRRPWRSLALIAASRSIDTLWVAELFAKLAWWYRGQPSCVSDLRDLSLRLVEYYEQRVTAQVEEGQSVLISLRSMHENPTAIPMARWADGVLLCVGLGKTAVKEAEQTIAEVGRDRVLGAIVVRKRRSDPASSRQK